jgi:hypothetical protein
MGYLFLFYQVLGAGEQGQKFILEPLIKISSSDET